MKAVAAGCAGLVAGSSSEINFQPMDRTDVELRIPNIDKARSLLGFQPAINLEEGLRRTIEWYRGQM